MSIAIAHGLYTWKLTYEDGSERIALGSSLDTLITGSTPIIAAQRGPAFTGDGPPPVVSALVPDTAALGSPDFTLHVQGSFFQDGDQIIWNGSPEPTTFVSPTELTTGVNMATAMVAMTIPVSVRPLAGPDSASLDFTLTEQIAEGGRRRA